MKLRAALMVAKQAPPGVFFIDEADETRVTVSFHGPGLTRLQIEKIAAAIADALPEAGIEI